MPPGAKRVPLKERFWKYVDIQGPNECWLWLGGKTKSGYGKTWAGGRRGGSLRAHRAAWELAHDCPIPDGMTIDHVKMRGCISRLCCNPAHLEPVTATENIRRGGNSLKTHCPKNHPYNEQNTYVQPNGARVCKVCRRERDRTRVAV